MAAWATACGAPAEAFDAGGDCDDRDPAVGWVHDCRYATISPGPSPAGFGRDIAVADVDGDGVTDGVVLWPQDRPDAARRAAVAVVYGPVLPGVVPRERIVDTTTPNTVGPRFAVADFLEDGRSTVVVSDSFRGQAAPWWLDPGGGREPEALDLFVFTQVEVGQLDGDGGRNDLVTVTSAPSDPTYRDVEVASFEGGSHRVLGRYRATAVIDAAILFDLDQDGVDEVLVSTAGDSAQITWATAPAGELPLEEVGLGSWQADLSVGTIARMVPAGDHNGDGYADLMVVPFRLGEVWLVHGGEEPSFGAWAAVLRSDAPELGEGLPDGQDLDRDGFADVWFGGDPPAPPLFGPLAGTVEVGGAPTGQPTALGDADGDGRADLWVAGHVDAKVPGPGEEVVLYLGAPDW